MKNIRRFFLDATPKKISNVIVFTSIITISILAWLVYTQNFDNTVTYRFPTQDVVIVNETNGKQHVVYDIASLNLVFSTTSFSSQNPIKVKATLYLETRNDKDWKYVPEKQDIIFFGASTYPPIENTDYDYVHNAVITLNKYDDPPHYYGEGQLLYTFEGTYSYKFLRPIVTEAYLNPRILITNSMFDQQFKDSDIFVKEPANFTTFTVSSSDATSTLKINDVFIALTLVLIIFGIIESRELITSCIERMRKSTVSHE